MTSLYFLVVMNDDRQIEKVAHAYTESSIVEQIKNVMITELLHSSEAVRVVVSIEDGELGTRRYMHTSRALEKSILDFHEKRGQSVLLTIGYWTDNLLVDHNERIARKCGRRLTDTFDAIYLWLYNRASEEAFGHIFDNAPHYWEKFVELKQDSGKFWHYLEREDRVKLMQYVKNEYKLQYDIVEL